MQHIYLLYSSRIQPDSQSISLCSSRSNFLRLHKYSFPRWAQDLVCKLCKLSTCKFRILAHRPEGYKNLPIRSLQPCTWGKERFLWWTPLSRQRRLLLYTQYNRPGMVCTSLIDRWSKNLLGTRYRCRSDRVVNLSLCKSYKMCCWCMRCRRCHTVNIKFGLETWRMDRRKLRLLGICLKRIRGISLNLSRISSLSNSSYINLHR